MRAGNVQVGCRPSGLVILEGDEEEVRNCFALKFVFEGNHLLLGIQTSDVGNLINGFVIL